MHQIKKKLISPRIPQKKYEYVTAVKPRYNGLIRATGSPKAESPLYNNRYKTQKKKLFNGLQTFVGK